MYAIIDVGGKQYRVQKGDTIFVDRLKANENDSYIFKNVLAIVDNDDFKFGDPLIKGATVVCDVVKHLKSKKIRVFKYKPKKNYSRRYGHRQHCSKVLINAINVS